jgi:hypothetical protein
VEIEHNAPFRANVVFVFGKDRYRVNMPVERADLIAAALNAQEGLRAALVQEHSYVWSKPVEWCNVCKLLTATALLQPAAQEVT